MADRLQVLVESRIDPFENALIVFVSAFDTEINQGFQTSSSIPFEKLQSMSARDAVTEIARSLNEAAQSAAKEPYNRHGERQ